MDIKSISIIRREDYTDLLLFETNLPDGMWPFNGNLTLRAEVANGTGEEYCKTHFPDISIKNIHTK